MKYDQEAHLAWGRAVCAIIGVDPNTVLARSLQVRPGAVTWTAVDPESGDRGTQRADISDEQEKAIDALPSPWHPAPPKPEHRWVEVTQACERDYHFECTGCGATYTQRRDACREDDKRAH